MRSTGSANWTVQSDSPTAGQAVPTTLNPLDTSPLPIKSQCSCPHISTADKHLLATPSYNRALFNPSPSLFPPATGSDIG